jgi:hypothetical protein
MPQLTPLTMVQRGLSQRPSLLQVELHQTILAADNQRVATSVL